MAPPTSDEPDRAGVPGTFRRSNQTVTVAIDFLNGLAAEGIEPGDLQQGHLDRWVATGPTTRLVADRFLRWAVKSRLVASDPTLPKHRRGTSPRFRAAKQDKAMQHALHSDELTPRDRAAAILVLVFAQQIEKVVRLTWDDVTVTDDLVTVRLPGLEIALPELLDGPWRQLADRPGHDQTAAHPTATGCSGGTPPASTSTP